VNCSHSARLIQPFDDGSNSPLQELLQAASTLQIAALLSSFVFGFLLSFNPGVEPSLPASVGRPPQDQFFHFRVLPDPDFRRDRSPPFFAAT